MMGVEDHKAGGTLRIGVAGLGTVGCGVIALLETNRSLIEAKAGRTLTVTAVAAQTRSRQRPIDISSYHWIDDPVVLAQRDDVDVVVELMGGASGAALELVQAALSNGKSVVTANKALLAKHGGRLGRLAADHGASIGFEAAVAGGIPVIKALREGLAGNRITRISGILNGTCNYILTTMRDSGRDFADVLREAQDLGFAEADPSMDIDGHDSAQKLAILASLAFNTPIDAERVYVEGIRDLSRLDIEHAEELGYRIKLLGTAVITAHGIEQRVHPTLVPLGSAIAQVNGVFNAVEIEGDAVGPVLLQGRGAGSGPTASAVVADLIDQARGRVQSAFIGAAEPGLSTVAMSEHSGGYYVRLMVNDQPGVIADITAELRNENVSVEAMIQRRPAPGRPAAVVLTTHPSQEMALGRALRRIGSLGTMLEPPKMLRIEG